MRVLYDSAGFMERFGGVSQSFVKLMTHLPTDIEPVLAVERTCNLALQGAPFSLPGYPNHYNSFICKGDFRGKWRLWQLAQRFFPKRYPDYEAVNRQCLNEHFERGDFDIWHLTAPHVTGGEWKRVVGKKPIVVTVHDLIPEIIQHDERIASMRREVLAAATRVVAVSENTKRDIMRLYGTPADKISVIHHGCPISARSPTPYSLIPNPYLLYVGKRAGYKNWAWFVEAVAPLLKERGLRLVCTGEPFTWCERRLLRRLGIERLVEQRFVSADELTALYANAVAFVYPSLYEGFGLPILDAFAAGCPVLLANRSCFPEVAGEAALYFDPGDGENLRRQVQHVLDDSAWREELIAKGRRRVQEFSWEESARMLAEVYREVGEV